MRAAHKILDVVRLGLHSLRVHMGRSVLTALGIVFAVWSVIAMLAINEGASYDAQQALRELGSDNIIVESVKPPDSESKASAMTYGALSYGMTHADAARLAAMPNVRRAAFVHRTLKYAYAEGRNLTVSVIATGPEYARVARVDVVAGRFLSSADVLLRKPHCIITQSLARRLFAYAEPLGRTVRLSNEPFVVVGVLSQLPRALAGGAGSDVGNHVIIPISTDRTRFGIFTVMGGQGGETLEKVDVSQAILQMEDDRSVLAVAKAVRSVLDRFHEEQDYEVTVPLELIEQMKKQRRLWNIMFLTIASISLVVGGIGIMNIMLASVTERTREIGIRRALGAKRRDIIVQFLVESVALTTVGGLAGIAVGLMVPSIVQLVLKVTAIIAPVTMLLPLVMAVAVGLVAGLYPAYRAAYLDPIVALRHE